MKAEERILRWDIAERIEHHFLMICVPIMIITGLPLFLREYFSWLPEIFGIPFMMVGGITGVTVFRVLHRIFGATLICVAVFHVLFHIFVRRRTRMLPTLRDFRDMFATWAYYVGIRKEPPKIGFHDPSEKLVVYWLGGVIGGGLAGVTGLILAFPQYFPWAYHKWALVGHDLAFVIILFVFVMHLYMTIFFAPHKPLLDAMMVDGTVPEEYVKEHHPLWYEELKKGK